MSNVAKSSPHLFISSHQPQLKRSKSNYDCTKTAYILPRRGAISPMNKTSAKMKSMDSGSFPIFVKCFSDTTALSSKQALKMQQNFNDAPVVDLSKDEKHNKNDDSDMEIE